MFEGGDIITNYNDIKGIVLKCDENMIHLLLYDLTTVWVDEKDFYKIGCTYAIYKSLYDLRWCDDRTGNTKIQEENKK